MSKRWLGGHIEVVPVGRRSRTLPFAGLSHAGPDGGPVLKQYARLGTVNGVFINTRWGCVWLAFRGVGTLDRIRTWLEKKAANR